jgi:eukaryotic-like serine/threonine-protein kinase
MADQMRSGRRRDIEQLYHAALDHDPDSREDFLVTACGTDEDLRREVVSLLAHNDPTALESLLAARPTTTDTEPRTMLMAGARLGPYQIVGPLGEGGMGKVFRALDTRLGRAVAIKISNEQFSKRFQREARAISALNHPNICTLYDVGSLPSGTGYMVTELVEGETLRAWLKSSPDIDRALEVARQILAALRAAHEADIIHRDLKPANIMIRCDGYVKVLDFGLAKRIRSSDTVRPGTDAMHLSVPGQLIGTVAYMSPEQILGRELDGRSDLFAFGIILYEMISGRHPWPRESTVDMMHAILHDEPPPLESAWLGVLVRLLCKNPDERYASTEAILEALANPDFPPTTRTPARRRLIVLPFRILRPNSSSDFLSVSLPDAITNSLAAIDSLLVRSTMVASKLNSVELDVKMICEQAQVDAILTGSILSDGENIRVSSQLVQAPDGTVLWSNTSDTSLRDIFRLQDNLVDRIVQSLALPLTDREQRALRHDIPANALGYEFFLRANQIVAAGYSAQNMTIARDLYLQSVDADSKYAPSWACLGRTYRYIAKFIGDPSRNLKSAEEAFQTAFDLNPDLALAHNFYTAHEADLGRSLPAMTRLLKRAHTHHNDPNLLTGLVQACRYCGLLTASLGAHAIAKQLDPNVRTSVAYTYLHLGEFQKALDHCPTLTDFFVVAPALEALGRVREAIALAKEFEKSTHEPFRHGFTVYRACLEGDYRTALEARGRTVPLEDPEARFFTGCLLAKMNDHENALKLLSLAIDGGYQCHYALLHDRWLDSLRSDARFAELVKRAAGMSLERQVAFTNSGGDRLLGAHTEGT